MPSYSVPRNLGHTCRCRRRPLELRLDGVDPSPASGMYEIGAAYAREVPQRLAHVHGPVAR